LRLEDELVAYLDRIAPASPHKTRNICIVRYFYGFDRAPWPTLEATAEAFGLGTRERVRQILNGAFRNQARACDLPALSAAARLLGSQPFWPASEFLARLEGPAPDARPMSLRGLLNLMQDLELASPYELYDHNLERLTRSHFTAGASYVVARADVVGPLKATLQEVRRVSCRLGLGNTARLEALEEAAAWVKALLKIDPNCWRSADEGDFWYGVESRENALVALAAKVFAVVDQLPPRQLAETLANGLRGRASRKPRPELAQVEAWVMGSRYFAHRDDRVTFLDRPAELTPVEKEVVSYLSASGRTDYKALKAHLQARGVVNSVIPKAATLSPLVHVDRSGGSKAYRYSLIGRQ
jgi:hypothetical protein